MHPGSHVAVCGEVRGLSDSNVYYCGWIVFVPDYFLGHQLVFPYTFVCMADAEEHFTAVCSLSEIYVGVRNLAMQTTPEFMTFTYVIGDCDFVPKVLV